MAYKRKPKTAELVEKIAEAKGNISAIARAYGVARRTVYGWIAESVTAQQALADEREAMVDTAESILYRRVAVDQDMTAVAYVLNNMKEAKRRGWGPRQEVSGVDGDVIRVTVRRDND